jgi:cytochrome c-type biogenesis protein CcmH/NrfG
MSEPTRTHATEDPCPTTATAVPATAAGGGDPAAAPAGYELVSLIGSGGMGVVYRARELALDRDVAVKVLHSRFGRGSPAAARFLDEARITGQLQHPGIPPIHHVGTLPDGRPFLAMKLIKGDTLEALLKSRQNPAADPGRFLATFEQVCQAVGYAHAHGVIHRDLKPANVMVGAFGEVQVMDWGLAKLVGDDRPSEPRPDADTWGTEIRSLRDRGELTQAGSLLGTPAYMPPEQAIGAVDQVDKRSDVFGLGGILCVILTGQPPYLGADSESTRQLAARARLEQAFTRLEGCGAEPELVALAKRCLAPEKGDRPADAGGVADAVAALRADAERRARQAEMDRARAEVQAAEERKRRRVRRALALAIVGLVAVAGVAAWWVDRERAQRRADKEAEQLRQVAAAHERVASLKAHQLVTERDVGAALKEAQVLREEGWKQADDPDRWALTLAAARSSVRRAEGLLAAGEPTDELAARVAAAAAELGRDERDRVLLAELDRVADGNEIRLLFPFQLTAVTSRQFATVFRTRGIDLLAVPTAEAVAWLKGHRFRGRLAIAVRNWQQSLPAWDVASVADAGLVGAVGASAAVAGNPPVAALSHDPGRPLEKLLRKTGPLARLTAILDAVTEDPFTREWWDAVGKKDAARLGQLAARPEIGRLSSREMASFADGLNPFSGTPEVLGPFLRTAHERFPGEFWVHFRLALQPLFTADPKDKELADESLRHFTAALALRPKSAVARAALGMELIEKGKDSAAGLHWLRSAAEVDPTSPWPHLFLGMYAIEKEDWPGAFRALKEAVRVDPDTGFFMTSSAGLFMLTGATRGPNRPAEADVVRFLNELIALHPEHPGGYDLLGRYYLQTGDHRAALAQFRRAWEFVSADYPARSLLADEVGELEAKARWGEKLPGVLRGEVRPAPVELADLAGYCANFDRKFALATRFAAEAVEADPKLLEQWALSVRFVGWAAQAGAGRGADADVTPLAVRERCRRLALGWMREILKRRGKEAPAMVFFLNSVHELAPVRDPKELAKLPPAERAAWEEVWAAAGLAPAAVAPPPREAKRP